MTTYLNKHDLLYINQQVLAQSGTLSQLLNEAILEGALMRPQTVSFYQNADIIKQGAFLIAGITLVHAFLDGNKGTALVAGYTFFRINEHTITSLPLELARQIESLVSRTQPLGDAMQNFIAWLNIHVR